ncbi:MAG: flagellar basal body rod C-terminal domain-containing protein [Rhodospirillales bacterium]|jgi:flagellar basal-body rod protein FlgC|nr:flagellar basal body rod C-terminal domain-containing protein [Rhodospirillales bacterium]
MTITGALSSAVSSLVAHARDVGVTADNVANVSTPGFRAAEVHFTSVNAGGEPGGVEALVRRPAAVPTQVLEASNVDLADQFSRLIQARTAYGAGIATLKTASDMLEALTEVNA